jgi:hypothetical protein
MRTLCCIALAACVGLLAITSMAQANPLPPGAFVTPDTQGNGNIGTVLASFSGQPFSFNVGGATVAGTYGEQVSTGSPNNPLGGLTFTLTFQVTTPPQIGYVQSASMYGVPFNPSDVGGFAGFTLDAAFFQPGGTTAPNAVARSGNGGSVAWDYVGVAATSTGLLILNTDAPAFNADGLTGFSGSGGGVGNLRGYQPVAPEPASLTLALVGLPLAGAFGYRRLRRGKPA